MKNKALQIKEGLKKVGRKAFLADGEWISKPFYVFIEPKFKNDKSNFESVKTEIGVVNLDYFKYIGPFDHNIEELSENTFLIIDKTKYIFRKKECVKCGDEVLFYTGILRKVWERCNDLSRS